MTTEQKIKNIIKGTEMLIADLKIAGTLTNEIYQSIMECQNNAIAALVK